jgi:hypothetical protein
MPKMNPEKQARKELEAAIQNHKDAQSKLGELVEGIRVGNEALQTRQQKFAELQSEFTALAEEASEQLVAGLFGGFVRISAQSRIKSSSSKMVS